MKSEWREVQLKDLAIINRESYSTSDKWDYVNYLDTGNLTRGVINEIRHIDLRKDRLPSRARRKVVANDVVYSTVRPNQEHYGIIRNPVPNMLVSTGFVTITVNDKLDPAYLYYFMSQHRITDYLHAIAEQRVSTYPALNVSDLENLDVIVPPISTQKSIANTLSCLDAKIEVNNRIIKNLEEQAQAIFKSWFIDFEPFREGEFVESELGMIPKGWKAGTIADLGEVVGGSTPSKKFTEYFSENGIAWITPKDLSLNKNKFVSKGQIDITQLGLKNSSAKVMPKGTVLFSSRAPIGYIAIAKNEVTTNQGFKSVVPREDVGTEYVYHFLKNNVSTIEAVAGGSTFKEVSGTTMKQIPALIPSKSVLEEFKKAIHLHFQLQELLEEQNTTLATLRDTLLPKLMSGEIEVPID